MEIPRILELYKKNSPSDFFEWAFRGRPVEIRLVSDSFGNKFQDWDLKSHFSFESRFSSFFIKSYDDLRKILLYNYRGSKICLSYNVFCGVNPRRKIYLKSKNGLLYKSYYGGLVGVSHIQNILADIEHCEREGNATEEQLEDCFAGARFLIKALNLEDYYLNCSGHGVHLWIRLDKEIELPIPKTIETEDKLVYDKHDATFYPYIKMNHYFIERINSMLQKFNPKLKVDLGAKDFSRIARPVGSWNVKVGKTPRAVGTIECKVGVNIGLTDLFLEGRKQIPQKSMQIVAKASISKNHRYTALTIEECPLVKLLMSGLLPSKLSRNHYLEMSLARLLRDNNIQLKDIQNTILKINTAQLKAVSVDYSYLEDESSFNSEAVNHYCVESKIDLLYQILENIPEVREGLISESHYRDLNGYSLETVKKMAILTIGKPKDYKELKEQVKLLVNKYDKITVLFTLKWLYQDEWDYYDKNRIMLQLLNKTRVKK